MLTEKRRLLCEEVNLVSQDAMLLLDALAGLDHFFRFIKPLTKYWPVISLPASVMEVPAWPQLHYTVSRQ